MDVIITAQFGKSSKTAALRILPPKLSTIGCEQPPTVVPDNPLKCTVWIDGPAPEPITVVIPAML